MNVIFRTDASHQIGSGHVMRSLTLADELRQLGADVMFICREHPGNLIGMIEGKGYSVKRLQQVDDEYIVSPEDVAHASWLGASWETDAGETIAALGNLNPQWLIIDHYAIDRRWEEALRPHVGKIMVIDDLADRPHDCDLLLDQNLYHGMETRYDGLVPLDCIKLIGPRHALLRPEFAVARRSLRKRDGLVRRVLVFFGGVDPTNMTGMALQALAGIADRQFAVDVVVGGGNQHKEQIRGFCASRDGFSYHCQVETMAELMAAADLAIGAGGSTTWERCFLELPTITMVLATNQLEPTSTLADLGASWNLGWHEDVNAEQIMASVNFAIDNPQILREMSIKEHLLTGNRDDSSIMKYFQEGLNG